MLNMGFVDDVELILKGGGAADTMQTLLFSATLPAWVKDITKRFLRKDHKMVDLVGTDKMKVCFEGFSSPLHAQFSVGAGHACSCGAGPCCGAGSIVLVQGSVLQGSACASLVRADEVQMVELRGFQPT